MKYILTFFGLMIIFMSFNFLENKHCEIPKNEQVVNNLMSQSAERLSKKYKMKSIGIGVGMPSGVVKYLDLEFNVPGPLSKKAIRKLLINSSNDFLTAINKDEYIRPYLECYPFEKNKIEIVLYFKDKKYNGLEHPDIRVASIRKSKIEYKTFNIIDDTLILKSKDVESEEDALRALKEED